MKKPTLMHLWLFLLSLGFLTLGYLYWHNLNHVSALKRVVEGYQKEEHEAIEKIAALDAQLQIRQQSLLSLKETLMEKSESLDGLSRQLEFYRLILEPSEKRQGIELHDYTLKDLGNSQVAATFTLIHLDKKHRRVSGTLGIRVKGVLSGRQKEVSLEALAVSDQVFNSKLNFKFYQTVETRIALPEGFKPQQLILSAQLDSKQSRQWSTTVDWILEN